MLQENILHLAVMSAPIILARATIIKQQHTPKSLHPEDKVGTFIISNINCRELVRK